MNRKSKIAAQKGFTLTELIIYVALVGILLTAAGIFARDILYGNVKAQAKAKVESEGRFAIEKLRQEVVQGNALDFAGGPGVLKITQPDNDVTTIRVNGNSGSPLILQVCTKAPPACIAGDIWQSLTSTDVEATLLTFTDISSGTSLGEEAVKINLTLKTKNPSGKPEFDAQQTFQTSISLRL